LRYPGCGRIDAIAYDGVRPEIVIDWKTDIEPNREFHKPSRDAAGQGCTLSRAQIAPDRASVRRLRAVLLTETAAAGATLPDTVRE
jgi:hypothetical protein